MAPVAMGSAIGAAALTFGRGAVGAAGKGLSFAAELLGGGSGQSDAAKESTQAADAAIKLRCHELSERIGTRFNERCIVDETEIEDVLIRPIRAAK